MYVPVLSMLPCKIILCLAMALVFPYEGLRPQERAEWDYKTKVGIAEALAKSEHPIVPTIMMGGAGDGKNGATALDAVGMKYLMDIADRISSNK